MRRGRSLAVAATLMAVFADAPAAAPSRASGKDDLSRAFRTGHYEEARRLARARLSRAPDDAPVIVMAARAEMALGRYEEARGRLERAASAHPDDLPLRDTLMRLYETVGNTAAAAPLVEASYGDWNAGKVDRTHPADLLAIATAVRLDGNWKDANDVLRDAVRADRRATAANLDWGLVLLAKHNAADAEACFRDVLKVDAAEPDAHVGLGRVALEAGYDAAAARDGIARALAVNPAHAGALALRAELALDAEDWPAARADIAAIRRTNPHDPGAARVEAAAALLLDDPAAYARARALALEVNPHDGAFFAFVAEALTRHRRYDDAREVASAGVAANPEDAPCLQALATTLLRLGEEARGIEILRRAWTRDPSTSAPSTSSTCSKREFPLAPSWSAARTSASAFRRPRAPRFSR